MINTPESLIQSGLKHVKKGLSETDQLVFDLTLALAASLEQRDQLAKRDPSILFGRKFLEARNGSKAEPEQIAEILREGVPEADFRGPSLLKGCFAPYLRRNLHSQDLEADAILTSPADSEGEGLAIQPAANTPGGGVAESPTNLTADGAVHSAGKQPAEGEGCRENPPSAFPEEDGDAAELLNKYRPANAGVPEPSPIVGPSGDVVGVSGESVPISEPPNVPIVEPEPPKVSDTIETKKTKSDIVLNSRCQAVEDVLLTYAGKRSLTGWERLAKVQLSGKERQKMLARWEQVIPGFKQDAGFIWIERQQPTGIIPIASDQITTVQAPAPKIEPLDAGKVRARALELVCKLPEISQPSQIEVITHAVRHGGLGYYDEWHQFYKSLGVKDAEEFLAKCKAHLEEGLKKK